MAIAADACSGKETRRYCGALALLIRRRRPVSADGPCPDEGDSTTLVNEASWLAGEWYTTPWRRPQDEVLWRVWNIWPTRQSKRAWQDSPPGRIPWLREKAGSASKYALLDRVYMDTETLPNLCYAETRTTIRL